MGSLLQKQRILSETAFVSPAEAVCCLAPCRASAWAFSSSGAAGSGTRGSPSWEHRSWARLQLPLLLGPSPGTRLCSSAALPTVLLQTEHGRLREAGSNTGFASITWYKILAADAVWSPSLVKNYGISETGIYPAKQNKHSTQGGTRLFWEPKARISKSALLYIADDILIATNTVPAFKYPFLRSCIMGRMFIQHTLREMFSAQTCLNCPDY